MAAAKRNGWKIFGIIVIAVVLVALAFVIGRSCERKKDDEAKTTTTTRSQTPPSETPSSSGDSSAAPAPAGAETTPAEEPGPPTLVSTHDTIGPCIGGFQEVIHTTEYSDGTSASSIGRQPCEEPDIIPVPEEP